MFNLLVGLSLIPVLSMIVAMNAFNGELRSQNEDLESSRQELLYPPPQGLQHMAFGYNEVLADSLWLRWIQDLRHCGRKRVPAEKFWAQRGQELGQLAGSDEFQGGEQGLDLQWLQDEQICHLSWSYQMLDAITEVSSRFRMPYALGAASLSVLLSDPIGAQRIFERGVEQYSTDWKILYRAAYNALYEVRKPQLAADLLRRAAQHGGPKWFNSLASRLVSRLGQYELGLIMLRDYLHKTEDPELRKKLERRIAILESRIRSQKDNSSPNEP